MHVNDTLMAVQRIFSSGGLTVSDTFLSIAVVFLRASFVKKTLCNFFNSELKLHTTEQKPSNSNITILMGYMNILSEMSATQ